MSIDEFSLALSSPLETASGPIETRQGLLARYDHREETGLGEATPLPGWTESLSACRSTLTRALETADSEGHASALLDLEVADAPAARHGFTTALFDADARAEGVPLYQWLDDDRRCESVPVNATVGDADVDETVERARDAVDRGFDCLKLKVGARTVVADVDRVRAVREAVGDDVSLRADANAAWSREEAESALEAFEPLDVTYVEQPLASDDLDGLADLAGGPVGVAVDETLVDYRVAEVLERDAADVLIVKPMVLGGPGDAHTIATRALDAGVEPVVTTTVDGVVARTAAVHVAAAIPDVAPCGLATAELLAEDLGPDPAPVDDGRISVPQSSGLGMEPSEVGS
ncbi:o-succinylbenzoate synthase [Halobacteria archaeon HArc-gm2]|nr:o-succinylbenzoate synthase [Halobacteria archaeon HArc-gm2]